MRFKSIIGAFLFILLGTIIAFFVFVQTKSFGSLITKVISDISEKKAGTKVSIKSVGISVFPPGIEFNRVNISKEFGPESRLKAELGKLGFYISLIEFEDRKLTFGEIRLDDSVIDFSYPKDEEAPELKEIDRKIINKVFEISEISPIRVNTFLFHNTKFILNHEMLEAKRLKIFKKDKAFMTRFHISNLKPVEENNFKIDEFWGEAEITKKDILIHRLRVHHDVHTLLLKGEVKNYFLLKDATAAISGEASVFLKGIDDIVPLPSEIVLNSGISHIIFNLKVADQKIKGGISGAVKDLSSNLLLADELDFSTEFDLDKIQLTQLDIKFKDQSVHLLKPATVANLEAKKILPEKISAKVENLDLNNVLRFLGPSLNPLKGKLNGIVDFEYRNGDYFFKPQDKFIVRDLGLVVGESDPFTVLMIKKAVLTNSSFKIINSEFHMSSLVRLEHSVLEVDGLINKSKVDFTAFNSQVNFEDFGDISDLGIKGKGILDIRVKGALDDTVINISGLTKKFEILGYQLGDADKDVSILLRDSNVIINKFESQYNSTHLTGTGVVNYENSDIHLGINSQQARYHDLTEILRPIFSKLDFMPSDLDFNAKIDASIFGKTKLNDLKVKSKIQFSDLFVYGENFSSGVFSVGMAKQVVSINDFIANKGKGEIKGDFSFNLLKDSMKLNYAWDNLNISSFGFAKKVNFNLDGRLQGTLTGEGTTKDYHLDLIGKLLEAKSHNYKFEDSLFDLDIYPNRIEGEVHLLGKILESSFDLSLARDRFSNFNAKIDVPNLKPIGVALLGQHLEAQDISGRIKMSLESKFKGMLENLTLQGTLNQLSFVHPNFKINHFSETPSFIVENGRIDKWNLSIQERDLYFVSKGVGTFGKNIDLKHEVNFNSKIFEVLFASVLSSEGYVQNVIKVIGDKSEYDLSVSSKTQELDLSINGIPFPINDLTYSIDYSNHRLLINQMMANLDNGSISFNGDVFFDADDPDINLKFSLDRAEFPILGKSILNLTGEGIILGNQRPYNLGGEIVINKAQIVNELSDFSSKSGSLGQVRFLPKNQDSIFEKLVNLNLNVKADNLIKISNSMMDIGLKGEVTLLGNPVRPRGEGRLYTPVNTSRVFFKNSEYFITTADLNFSPKKEIANPDFDIQSYTFISTYKVFAKAYGDVDRFTFDLTSDPPLPRNSILSLIAFGYTNEIQNSLESKDQQSLTQVGVGSFVFDQFKISDILKKQFGLQINLGTVLEQSQTDSLLSGRSQGEGQGQSLGRTRSATKIELKKRLDEALTLSVSSTMGGSIGQRQSMNLNYGLSKKVQLEGVYELRTNEEGQEDIISNSIGADLKFRWTFK